jgi:SAM-dependent methyltransferase
VTPGLVCAVCGGSGFRDQTVIWDELAEGWHLTPEERAMVDRQQGTCCTGCGGNLRSIALAEAILAACGAPGTLQDFVASPAAAGLRVLEINEAGTLSPVLARMPGHLLAAYPAVDMRAMPYADASFDLIVHSDTLEHVPDPERALLECARVLSPAGALCFTVPVLPARMTLARTGLPALYHGSPATQTEDLRVRTDYGADVWHAVHQAGLASVTLSRFGEGLAITATHAVRRRPLATEAGLRGPEGAAAALVRLVPAPLRRAARRLLP